MCARRWVVAAATLLTCTFAISSTQDPVAHCAAFGPPALVRQTASFYMRSLHYANCHDGAKALLEYRIRSGDYEVFVDDDDAQQYTALVSTYIDSCLFPLSSDTTKQILGLSTVAALTSALGYIYIVGSPFPFHCSAIRMGRRVVTARHCFADANGTVAVPATARFKSIAEDSIGLPLTISRKYHPQDIRLASDVDDWLVLDLPIRRDYPPNIVQVRMAIDWEPTMLVSFDPRRIVLPHADTSTRTSRVIEPFIDLSPLCRVSVIQDRFLFHACQSEIGTSGTPFLSLGANGQLTLLAVHNGTSSRVANECNAHLAEFFPNYATVLPEEAARMLNKEP
jgi:hypothetical protein